MKRQRLLLAAVALALSLATATRAQVKIGANATIVSPNAILDVEGTSGNHAVILQNGNVGMGTVTPQNKLHVNGTTQITGPLQTGGSASTAGNAGTTGQVLVSQGASSAPVWSTLSSSGGSGTIAGVYYAVGGNTVLIAQNGSSSTDLGTSLSITLPAASDLMVTYSGVPMALNGAEAFQGTLELSMDGTKVNSLYYGSSGAFYSGSGGYSSSPLIPDIQPGATTISTTYVIPNVPAGTHSLSLQGRSIYHGTFWNAPITVVGNSNPALQVTDYVAAKCRLTALVVNK